MKLFSKVKQFLINKKEEKIVAIGIVAASANAFVEQVCAAGDDLGTNLKTSKFASWLMGIVKGLGIVVAIIGVAMLAYAIINHTADNYSKCIFMIIGGGIMILAPTVISALTGQNISNGTVSTGVSTGGETP